MTQLLKASRVQVGDGRRLLGTLPGAVPSSDFAAEPEANAPSVALPGSPDATAAQAQADALAARLAELEHAYSTLETTAIAEKEAAYRNGMGEGISIGEAQAKRDHATQLEALRQGVSDALQVFQARLAPLEALSLDIARAALDKIFGDPALHADLIARTARHHLAQIAADSVLNIEVSPEDFPDREPLHDAFAAHLGRPGVSVKTNAQLPRGACLIGLSLGKLDVSLPLQHTRIASTLNELHSHVEHPAP